MPTAPETILSQARLPGRLLSRRSLAAPPEQVAPWLLGKLVLRQLHGELLSARIVETEAYLGVDDPAAHAFAGRTARTSVLFGPPGHAYVYFIYGMHSCLNVSCEPDGHAGCVLIRALEPVLGQDTMRTLRHLPAHAGPRLLTSGPGRLCQALALTRTSHNGVDLLDQQSDLQLRDDGFVAGPVTATPRIGITKAAAWPLRFLLTGNPYVSGPRNS